MFKSYLKIGWRNLIKNKGYSLINIGGLALGMAVTLLIALWINDELQFSTYHKNYKTIAKVYRNTTWTDGIETATPMPSGLGTLLRSEYGMYFKNVVMVRQQIEDRVLAYGEQKMTQGGRFIQAEGVDMFSLKMVHGSGGGFLNDMKSIILSESLSKKLFGSDQPVDKIVTMDGVHDLKVTGVYEDLPKTSELYGATFFAPLELFVGGKDKLNVWDNQNMLVYVQLHGEEEFKKVSAIIKDVMLQHVNAESKLKKPQLFLHPMSEWHLNSEFENGVAVTSKQMKMLWSFGAIGIFTLVLACINFMNLSTARSEKRAREVGIRKSMGSHRSQLIQQFFGESLLTAFISFVAAILIAKLALPGFNTISDKNIIIPWTDPVFWTAGIFLTFFAGILAGSYPALYLSSFNPVKVLKGSFKAGRSASIPRSILVTVQFTVSISLIIATVIVYQQIQFAKNRPVGYSREGLLSFFPRSPEFKGNYLALRNELKRTGAVDEIAEANYSINSTLGWNDGFSWKGKKYEPSFNTIFVTPEYGKTIGWQFIAGRDFSREIQSDMQGVVINESAWKTLGLKKPVGEFLDWNPGGRNLGRYKILGVVKDMVKGSPFESTDASIIFLSNSDLQNLYVRISPKMSIHEALPKIQKVFNQLFPSAPFDYTFADEDYEAKFRAEERTGELAAAITILAVLISCLGLFGLTSFVAEQRTKEIGIRKVLGASVTNLWNMLSKDFIGLVIIACLVSVPIAFYAMSAWLQNYEYRMKISWEVFLLAAVSAICIAFITVSFQAVKAAVANPVKSLRTE
jgi:putative ABC transport system permease protein